MMGKKLRKFAGWGMWLLLLLVMVACQGADVSPVVNEPEEAVAEVVTDEPPTVAPTETVAPAVTAEPTAPAVPTATPDPDPLKIGTNGNPWWNDAVFYEVFVRSFYDSDGDGVGDINGLIEKLDYINDGDPNTTADLGATGIWLMPIAVSPSYHGYDVVDYFEVDPEYGTNEDFARLMEEAHARGIRVIVDLVMNHTSVEHPWFLESQDPDSDKRDWYIWADEAPSYRGPWGQRVWHPAGDSQYYGVFWVGMPDLNFENPEVTAAMYEAAEFWLTDMGVDGFRLDAIKHMIEEDNLQENTYATHDWLEAFYEFYKEVDPDALTVGEAWTSTAQVVDYTGDEVDIAFQFDLALDILNSSKAGVGKVYATTHTEVYDSFPLNQYATFITNHDQNRVMSDLRGNEGQARTAASFLLTGTGVPFIYYGEEIGMTGVKPDEDIRLPMQWQSNGPKVGFTDGTPWRPVAADFPVVSVARQTDDPDSLLSHYRDLIALRNTHEALRVGEWVQVDADSARIYAFLRFTEDETILVIINPNRNVTAADKYTLSLPEGPLKEGPLTAVSLYGTAPDGAPVVTAEGGFEGYIPLAEIPAESTHIIQLVSE